MYSALIVGLAAVNLGVALWTFLQWERLRSVLLLFNLLALAAVAAHVLIAGLGHWVGIGDKLRDLYALPILMSTFALPLTLFTFATISRRSGFGWARIDWGHGAVCLLAVALLIYSLPDIYTSRLVYPACWQDVAWYLRSVPPGLVCDGAAPEGPPTPPLPIVPATVLAAYLGLGAGLWWRQRWPWLLAAMGIGIPLMLAPYTWGPLPRFLGETLCFCAIAVTAARPESLHPRAVISAPSGATGRS